MRTTREKQGFTVIDRHGKTRMDTLRLNEAQYRARRVHGFVVEASSGKVVQYGQR